MGTTCETCGRSAIYGHRQCRDCIDAKLAADRDAAEALGPATDAEIRAYAVGVVRDALDRNDGEISLDYFANAGSWHPARDGARRHGWQGVGRGRLLVELGHEERTYHVADLLAEARSGASQLQLM